MRYLCKLLEGEEFELVWQGRREYLDKNLKRIKRHEPCMAVHYSSFLSAISFKDYLVSFFDGGQKPPDDEIPVEMPDSPRLPRLARRLRNTRVQTSMSELQQMAVVEPLNTEQPFILEQRRIEDEEDHDLM
ncbi:hypothetical protein Q1695_007176 [Nippostrongylus brasiliensis]|nr:hypothetical protein Q1695_007176 [Nippostrongylus brasiliensis]